MTKFALLGTASALALTLALSQGASANEPNVNFDDNQANLWSDGNANDSSSITKSYTDNRDNSVRATSDNDTNNSFNNREDTSVNVSLRKDEYVSVRKDETELEAKADDGSVAAVNGNAYDNSIGRGNSGSLAGGNLNNGQQTEISLGDVLVNLASANAGLHGATMSAALKAGVHSGAIANVDLSSMHGVAQINANTGIASQASNIALNSVVK